MSNDDEPRRLRNAQATIRDRFVDAESGLFTMNCVAGAGKSLTMQRIAAETIIRRYARGDRTPAQSVAVMSFTTDEAAAIGPGVCEHIWEIVNHELIPEAASLTESDVAYLVTRVRHAPFIGTVDSVLRDVFGELATDLGFEETPSIGNKALLKTVHNACYDAVAADPAHEDAIAELEAAYPDGRWSATPAEMLTDAVKYCRDQRLTTAAFERKLRTTQEAVYPGGRTSSRADIVTTIADIVDADAAADTDAALSPAEWDDLVAADQRLYDAWEGTLTAFGDVLEAYREQYRALIREYGVVSHTDVAFFITSVFKRDWPVDGDGPPTDQHTALRQRYHARLDSVIIDEAQDVSTIQHAALSQLVTPSMRVLACGDTLQSIYRWRHADPSLFTSACREGQYLGIDWDTHATVTAATTYRGTPDIAAGINTIMRPVFDDPTRGGLNDFAATYPGLDASRDPTADPSIHVTAFTGGAAPDKTRWVNPDGRAGEANILATYIAQGLADGTLTDETGSPQSITVVFRKRTRMDAYKDAFKAEGLTVQNASSRLFACSVVKAVLAVCDWLTAPTDRAQTRALLTDSPFDFTAAHDCFERAGYDLDLICAADDLDAETRDILCGLRDLRDQLGRFHRVPASVYLEDIIEQLALRADPSDQFTELPAAQRVAALDTLTSTVADWEADTQYPPAALGDLLAPFRAAPSEGPDIPSVTTDADVVFSTVHRLKGDQDDVIVLATPGFKLWDTGPFSQRFMTQGGVAALAPPTNVETAPDIELPPFDGGLYTPSGDSRDKQGATSRDVGLRWATEHWLDDADSGAPHLLGPDQLQSVAANERAEAWRLLYVALSRARDHLVIPLPKTLPGTAQPRDRWLDTLFETLEFSPGRTPTYAIDEPSSAGDLTIGVNDVEGRMTREMYDTTLSVTGAVPPRRDQLESWVPRFLDPSTAYPLTDDVDATVGAHLLDEAIHTETEAVADSLPITFETLGPEAVGTCLHEALLTLIEMDVPDTEIDAWSKPVRSALRDAMEQITPQSIEMLPDTERGGLVSFFHTSVVSDFLNSDLWAQIQAAEAVYVDHDLSGLVTAGEVEVEVHGEADILIDLGGGEWQLADLKIALTDDVDATQPRYELQIAAYEHILQQELGSAATIHASVETFGCVRRSVYGQFPPTVLARRVRTLVGSDESISGS
ncbi:UvrD-helicase domain-containing protein [Halorubrum ezzemoulense]|uniref:UvrD-helicase domain-containing protein n=1 Tax=Halorubrum ezzemoulense TaxID=337243 RepID=UPI00232BD2FD|nr:UvrD-helicase domain-containing protein [Halorubrum ezzemoulense]MDB2249257.1 UvrD-helicase domain-containing protein [Halorubrum ezzemoulense]